MNQLTKTGPVFGGGVFTVNTVTNTFYVKRGAEGKRETDCWSVGIGI